MFSAGFRHKRGDPLIRLSAFVENILQPGKTQLIPLKPGRFVFDVPLKPNYFKKQSFS